MLMITITTLTNSFILNGTQYNKGSLIVSPTPTGAKFGYIYASLSDIEVDGVTYSTIEELHTALDTKLFKSGGGNGSGVAGLTWDDTSMMPVAGKVPVFSPQGLLSTGMPLFPENAVPLMYIDLVLQRFLGVFDSEVALNTAHPTGQVSQYAYVRDIDSTGDILRQYYWNDLAEVWSVLNKEEDDIYRATEGVTNKIWVNGKKIYRYIFHNVQVEDDSEILISLAGLGITEIVNMDYLINEDDRMHKDMSKLYISATNTSITVSPPATPSLPTSFTIILEYTK